MYLLQQVFNRPSWTSFVSPIGVLVVVERVKLQSNNNRSRTKTRMAPFTQFRLSTAKHHVLGSCGAFVLQQVSNWPSWASFVFLLGLSGIVDLVNVQGDNNRSSTAQEPLLSHKADFLELQTMYLGHVVRSFSNKCRTGRHGRAPSFSLDFSK